MYTLNCNFLTRTELVVHQNFFRPDGSYRPAAENATVKQMTLSQSNFRKECLKAKALVDNNLFLQRYSGQAKSCHDLIILISYLYNFKIITSKSLPFQTQTKRKHNPVTVNNVRISLEEIWNVCIFVEGNFFMRYITNIVGTAGTRVDIAVYLDIQDVIRICTSCEILSVLHVFCVSCPAHHLC